jgi:hypothetical protein
MHHASDRVKPAGLLFILKLAGRKKMAADLIRLNLRSFVLCTKLSLFFFTSVQRSRVALGASGNVE